jgi:hypothetical protein
MRKLIFLFLVTSLFILTQCSSSSDEEIKNIYYQSQNIAKNGDFDNAIRFLEENIPKKNRDSKYYFFKGLYIKTDDPVGRSHEAILDFLEAYKNSPENYDILRMIGSTYLILEEYSESITFLRLSIKEFTDNGPQPYTLLAEALYRNNQYREALIEIDKSLEINPEDSWSFFIKGLILSQTEGYNIFHTYYLKAIEIDPDNWSIKKDYALRLIEMDEYEKVELFLENERTNINEAWFYMCEGVYFLTSFEIQEAESSFLLAYNFDSYPVDLLKYLSLMYYFKKDSDSSINYLMAYLTTKKRNTIIYKPKNDLEYLTYFSNDKIATRLLNSIQNSVK